LQLGFDFLNVNQIQPAKAEFTRARELEPYNTQAELGLLKVSVFEMFEPANIDSFEPEIAERRLSAILQEHPNDTHALTFLGMVYRTPNPKEAEANFDKAIAADPANALAYFQKGFLLDLRGDQVGALRLYGEASRRSKWNQAFLNNLAYQYFQRRDYARAEASYRDLLNLDARLVLSYIMLANTELILGKVDDASLHVADLLRRLNDGVTVKLPRNHNEWYFHAEPGETMQLFTDAEKLAYIRYVAALTAHLRARTSDVRHYLAEIAREPAGKEAAMLVLQSDLRRLATAQPAWAAALSDFAAIVKTE
jgi:tetratricopeptide (TPR) repeat protein